MKCTRYDGSCRWKCLITDRFFETQADQEAFTESIIAEQGPDLTLAQRRALFQQNCAASPSAL